MSPVPNAIFVFVLFLAPALLTFLPFFAIAYWRRPFGGRLRDYALVWLGSAMAAALFLALLGLAEDLSR